MHIITHLHPSVSWVSLVKDIKLASSEHIKSLPLFKNFNGLYEGCGAYSHSFKDKDHLIAYVKNQKQHQKIRSIKEELIELLFEYGIHSMKKV